MATRVQQIASFIRRNAGQRFCDDCIASEIGVTRQTSNTITNAFHEAGGDFQKQDARCSGCGEDKLATTASGA